MSVPGQCEAGRAKGKDWRSKGRWKRGRGEEGWPACSLQAPLNAALGSAVSVNCHLGLSTSVGRKDGRIRTVWASCPIHMSMNMLCLAQDTPPPTQTYSWPVQQRAHFRSFKGHRPRTSVLTSHPSSDLSSSAPCSRRWSQTSFWLKTPVTSPHSTRSHSFLDHMCSCLYK